MSAFTKSVRVAHTQRTEEQRMLGVLLEPIGFYSGETPETAIYTIEVPKGFITDGVTIPWFLWWVMAPWGQETAAAIIHDWLYFTRQYDRKTCDLIFLEGLKVMKTPWLTRTFAYYVVRLFGGRGYETFFARYFVDRIEYVEDALDHNYDGDIYNLVLAFENNEYIKRKLS
jgi:hypothetical protein